MTSLESKSIESRFSGRDFAFTVSASGISADASLSGRFVLGEATTKLRKMMAELLRSGTQSVVLDLRAVSGLDNAALGELVYLAETLRDSGGVCAAIQPKGTAAIRLMEQTKVRELLHFFEEPEDARALTQHWRLENSGW